MIKTWKLKSNLLWFSLYACTPSHNSLEKVVISAKKGTTPEEIKPIWGHRFKISGDFDSDGQQETLTEFYYSHRDQKETNKYFKGIEDVWEGENLHLYWNGGGYGGGFGFEKYGSS